MHQSDESKRLNILRSLNLLDTGSEQAYDDLVLLAAQVTQCPMVAIAFLDSDRLWLKAQVGFESRKIARSSAFSNHTILQNGVFVVPNVMEDPRFSDSQAVKENGVLFYAGVPLRIEDGTVIGTFSVLDSKPRELPEDQAKALLALARQTVSIINKRKAIAELKQSDLALRESEQRYRSVTQSAQDAIISSNAEGMIIGWNMGASTIFGYSEEEALGQPLTLIIPPQFRSAHANGIASVGARASLDGSKVIGHTVELVGLKKDGAEFPIELSLSSWSSSSGRFFTGIIRDISERKRIEERLATSERMFRNLVQLAPDQIYIVDLRIMKRVYTNRTLRSHLGYPEGSSVELDDQTLRHHLHPDDAPYFESHFGAFKAMKDGEVTVFEVRAKHARGHWVWLRFQEAVFSRSSDGTVEQVIGIATDVTELRNARENLELRVQERTAELMRITQQHKSLAEEYRISERKLKLVTDAVPAFIAYVDHNYRYVFANRLYTEWLGKSGQDIEGRTIEEVLGPVHFGRAKPFYDQAIRGERTTYKSTLDWNDETKRHFFVVLLPDFDHEGRVNGFIVLGQDVTELQEAQKRVEFERSRLEAVLQQLPEGVVIVDKSGSFLLRNSHIDKLLGMSATSIEDSRSSELKVIGPDGAIDPSFEWPLERSMRTGEAIYNEEVHVEVPSGDRAMLNISSAPIRDAEEAIVAGVVVIQDITEKKRAEKDRADLEIREKSAQETSRLKSEFLATMSHEIRTPINGVMGMLGLLLSTNLTDEQRDFAETARRSADSLLAIINDILDFSKIEAGKVHFEEIDFDLQQALVDSVKTLSFAAQKKGIQLLTELDASLPQWVSGDPGRFRQVVLNLLSNAIKFTSKGHVVFSARQVEANERETLIRVDVVDTGIGMRPEVVERLFNAFVQGESSTSRRFGGTGLGLSISKGLVEIMGGTIAVESEFGNGSRFWFTARFRKPVEGVQMIAAANGSAYESPFHSPEASRFVADAHPALVQPARPTAVPRANQKRILVAEDNRVNQVIALKMLEKAGYYADAVANGLEVLKALSDVQYDLVLMDCQMPEMDGYDATKAIRASEEAPWRAIPIIAMTANAMEGEAEKCRAIGMDDYLTKPVSFDKLKLVIANWLEKKA